MPIGISLDLRHLTRGSVERENSSELDIMNATISAQQKIMIAKLLNNKSPMIDVYMQIQAYVSITDGYFSIVLQLLFFYTQQICTDAEKTKNDFARC